METNEHDQAPETTFEEIDFSQEEELAPLAPCSRCGWMEDGSSLPLSEDLEEYMRCVLGGKEFRKTYSMYDGKLKLTYRVINNRQLDALNKVMFKMADHLDEVMIQDSTIKLKLIYFLAEATLGEKTEEYPIPDIREYEQINELFNERFGDCPEPVVRMMSQTLMLFMQLQGILVTQGFDENFWKGAGLRSR